MDKFVGWDLSLPVNPICNNCGMQKEKQKGCCNDKHQTFQLKKDQLAAQINIVPNNSFHYLYAYYFSYEKVFSSASINKLYTAHSPPGLKVSPFILNCIFRI